jgi:hypothetical protein
MTVSAAALTINAAALLFAVNEYEKFVRRSKAAEAAHDLRSLQHKAELRYETEGTLPLAAGSSDRTTWTFDCSGDGCELSQEPGDTELATEEACMPSVPELELGCARAGELQTWLEEYVGEKEVHGLLGSSTREVYIPTPEGLEAFVEAAGVGMDRVQIWGRQQVLRQQGVRGARTLFNYAVDFDGDRWDYTTFAGSTRTTRRRKRGLCTVLS